MADEKRLIDANAFRDLLYDEKAEWFGSAPYYPEWIISACIDSTPTVDAVEVKCKVGDWVYALWEAPVKQKYIIYCAEVKEIRIGMRNCRLTTTYRLEPIMYRGHIHEYRDEDFGKLVFPSEKEAEEARAKMDGERREGECI